MYFPKTQPYCNSGLTVADKMEIAWLCQLEPTKDNHFPH